MYSTKLRRSDISTKSLLLLAISLLFSVILQAQNSKQDSIPRWQEKVSLGGYVKNMQTFNVTSLDQITMDELVHNRFNLKVFLNDDWTISAGLRNRIIMGNQLQLIQQLGTFLDYDRGWMDLSKTVVNRKGIIIHHTTDRLNLNYIHDNLEVTLGRQRINWGVALAWNPNDLFNAYNFIDFDYEERPGADAIRAQYYLPDGMTSFDVAVSRNALNQHTYAAKFNFNRANYDFQLLGGRYLDDWAIGAGWAGNIKNVGFKGESTYFIATTDDSQNSLSSTVSFDYSFPNATYINAAILYNGIGSSTPLDLSSGAALANFRNLTAKNLFPSKFASFITASYPITPLLQGSLAGMYGFGINLGYIGPSLTYSIRNDLDAALIGQVFLLDQGNSLEPVGSSLFFRLKWSFTAW